MLEIARPHLWMTWSPVRHIRQEPIRHPLLEVFNHSRFLPTGEGDMRFLLTARALYFWWKSSASMYQPTTDTFCTAAYFFDRRSISFLRN
jgi:hypothetical protein